LLIIYIHSVKGRFYPVKNNGLNKAIRDYDEQDDLVQIRELYLAATTKDKNELTESDEKCMYKFILKKRT